VPGAEYAFREKWIPGSPLQQICLVEHVRGNKWKARWIDPHPGLIDYVATSQIIVLWKGRKGFLKEEADNIQLHEYNKTHGFEPESPLATAVEQVFESVGEAVSCHRGILSASLDKLNRIRSRAGLPEYELKYPAYSDRKATLHLPFDQAFELGHAFCIAEPSTVLTEIETTERKWSHEATVPGGDYILPLLNSYRASWALIRQWCGSDAALATRDKRIEMLERLLWDAVYALQKAGADSAASKLRRAMEKG
jgi:hypothetical protein